MLVEAFSTVSSGIFEDKLAARATIEYWYEFTGSESRKTNISLREERDTRGTCSDLQNGQNYKIILLRIQLASWLKRNVEVFSMQTSYP